MSIILKYKKVYHTIFWMVCFFILFRLFTQDYYNGAIDFIYTALFIVPMIIIVYINRMLLKPVIEKKSIAKYLVGLLTIIIVGVGLHFLIYEFLTDIIFQGYFITSYFTIWEVVQYSLVFLFVSTLLKLAKDWFLVKDREIQLVQENHQVQLSSLKSQINPHFLFNSLNNIYALSADSPEAVRNYILKLSDALRYMIYDTDEDKVLLQEELTYLSDYIALEKLRMNNTNAISYNYPEDTSELIAPLLLLPLVENCFKHVDKQAPQIHINISLEKTLLTMTASNSFRPNSSKEIGGLGLVNLQKRLALLYPDKHELSSESKGGVYYFNLTIDLQP